MSGFSNLLSSWFRGVHVGTDDYGNRYYRERKPRLRKGTLMVEKRWVRYEGAAEGSKTPPLWNAWLHHSRAQIPTRAEIDAAPSWTKPHQENLSGTAAAYRPAGSLTSSASRAPTPADYEAWTPE